MIITLRVVLLFVALVLFLLAAFNVPPFRGVQLVPLGLAFVVGAWLAP